MPTYYVRTDGNNANTGTSNTAGGAWLTIQKAASTVIAGDTVLVADGTYAGAISETTSGSSGAHILYKSINKWGAKVIPSGAGSGTMWSVSGAYVDVDGFEITGTGSDTNVRNGLVFTGGNSTASNNWIHHVARNSGCDNQGGSGLLCNQAGGLSHNNYTFIKNLVHHIGNGCGFIQGIYFQSTGKVQNNIVHNCTGGLHFGHDDHDVIVSNNTVFRCSVNAYYFGGCQEAYTDVCPTRNMLFYNNICYDNTGSSVVSGPVAAEDSNNVLKYNCFFASGGFDLASPSANSRSNEQNVNPKFVNYQADGSGDYHLSATSAMIGNGFATYAPLTDYDGTTRPNPPSIGAYEFASGGDTVAPVLTAPTGTATGETTADLGVTTDEGNGTMYYWATTNATETIASIIANGDSFNPTSASGKIFNITGLNPATNYYGHFTQIDAADNTATAVNSAQFTTDTPTPPPPGINSPSIGGNFRRRFHIR